MGLLAVLAMSTVAATSAMAEPGIERGVCKAAKVGTGEFTDSLCTIPGKKAGKGKEFVWVPAAKATAFTATSGELALKAFTPEGAELPAVVCKKSKGKGKAAATTSTVVFTFEECTSAGEKCTGGAKAKAGQIVTFEVAGTLGMLGGAASGGEALVGTGPGGLFAEFKCGANEVKINGGVIGEVSGVNAKATTVMTLTFASTGSTQGIEAFEGGPNVHLAAEINGLGGGTFPFKSTFTKTLSIKGSKLELKLTI
ncbi:MAG TPA: hypothetical protein VN892_07530 [Solirubrobacteraceae bacterium]|nr:hypothetical protein [Solirubrobacteraceae bacterium]